MDILIIDGQGGKIGCALMEGIKARTGQNVQITAVGTNSIATQGMVKAGADRAATGENAVIVAARHADIIAGPIGIVLADSLVGEITPLMATAVAQSRAKRVLIPFQGCNTAVVGTAKMPLSELIEKAVCEICDPV